MKYIKHIFIFFFIKLPVQLAGIPILAVLLLFIPEDQEYLPKLFRWWDNHERYFEGNSKDDGLSGPGYIRSKWNNPTGWLARFSWLALRNPANYFQYGVLGRIRKPDYRMTISYGDVKEKNNNGGIDHYLNIGTHRYNNKGYYYQEVCNGNETLWELYIVWPLTFGFYFRLRMGWKLGGYYTDKKTGDAIQWVLAVTPLKRLD